MMRMVPSDMALSPWSGCRRRIGAARLLKSAPFASSFPNASKMLSDTDTNRQCPVSDTCAIAVAIRFANAVWRSRRLSWTIVPSPHRISAQTVPTLERPIARAAPRDKSMSRPRVNGPRSLIVTTVEAPVWGFVSFTRVPNGSFLCAAVRPSGRNAWPLAVPEPTLYWVAFIEPLGQLPWVGAATATLPNQVETSSKWVASMSSDRHHRSPVAVDRRWAS